MDLLELVHVDRPPSTRPFACEEPACPKSFARRSDLVRHMRIHSNDRPFVCHFEGCKRDFIQRSALTVHIRVHTGERPHHCEHEGCIKAFSDSSSLARHRRIHTGKRPYKCPVSGCTKTFSSSFCRRTTMAKHVKRNHPGHPLALTIDYERSSDSQAGSPSGDEGGSSPPSSRSIRQRSLSLPRYAVERPPLSRSMASEPAYYPSASTSQPFSKASSISSAGSVGWPLPNSIEQQQQQHREMPGQYRRIQGPESIYSLPPPPLVGGAGGRNPRGSPEEPEECYCQQPPHRHYRHQHAPQALPSLSQSPYLSPTQEYPNPNPQPYQQDSYRQSNLLVDMRYQRPPQQQQQKYDQQQRQHLLQQPSPANEIYSPAPIRDGLPSSRGTYLPSIGQLTQRQQFISPFASLNGPPPPSPTLTHYSSTPPLYGQSAASQEYHASYTSVSPVLQARRASSASAVEVGPPGSSVTSLGGYIDEQRGDETDGERLYPAHGGDGEGEGLTDDESYFRRPSASFPQSAQTGWGHSRGSFSSYVTQHIDRLQEGAGQYP